MTKVIVLRNKFKKTVLIDLDGVLNQYTGEYNEKVIPPPISNVEMFLETLTHDFDIILFTTRDKQLANNWLVEHKLEKYFVEVTNIKKTAWLIIDDRCIKFEGNYSRLIKQIKNFKTWWGKND